MSAHIHHPRWCRQEQCSDSVHRGRLITISPGDDDHAPVTLQMIQPRTRHAVPAIIVAGDLGVVAVSIKQAKAVQYTLRTLLRAAERGRQVTVPDQPDPER